MMGKPTKGPANTKK
jgi:hypothetical protein